MSCGPDNPSFQRGVSLVELLIALVIQGIILTALTQFYASGTVLLRTESELSTVQESGRFASGLLTRDIRSAGFAGCRHLSELKPRIIADDFDSFDTVTDALQLFAGGTGWTAPTGFTRTSGTDVVTVRYAGVSAHLTGNMTAENANIQIDGNPAGLEANDVILVTDCDKSDIFRATTVSNSAGTVTIAHANNANSDNRLSKAYGRNAFVYGIQQVAYFVGSNGEVDGLYRQATDSSSPVLVADNIAGFSARTVTDDDGTVVGLRFAFLLETADNVTTEARAYQFAGNSVNSASGDRRLRRTYSGFANIRNNVQ